MSVVNYNGSSTFIEVYEGNKPLNYITAGTPSAGQFIVSAAGTNIASGSPSINSVAASGTTPQYNRASYPNASNYGTTNKPAKIVFTVTYKRSDGRVIVTKTDQNFNNPLSYFLEIRKKNSESKESIVRKIVKDIRKNQDVSLIKYEMV